LSYNERRALETLPKEIAVLEKKLRAVEKKLAEPEFYTRDPRDFERATALMQNIQSDLTEAEERWMALELKREELEG